MSAKALKSRLVAKLLVSRKKISSGASIKFLEATEAPDHHGIHGT
jgi:hypothetical protein